MYLRGIAAVVALNAVAAQAVQSVQSTTWTSLGCYTDSIYARSLPQQVYVDGGMTVERCQIACGQAGHSLAGVEYGRECFCGDSLQNAAHRASPATDGFEMCTYTCQGDGSQICGGSNRLSLYTTASITTSAYKWTSQGCFTDDVNARAMPRVWSIVGGGLLTVEKCQDTCSSMGHSIAGVEYGGECYCGDSLENGHHLSTPADGTDACNFQCAGDSSQICGGPNRLSLYSQETTGSATPNPSNIDGSCYTDNVNARTLTYRAAIDGPTTVEKCKAACRSAAFTIAGLEYGGECWCGNEFSNGGVPAANPGCYQPCNGDSTQICGGSDRLSIHQLPAIDTSAYQSDGCYSDNVNARTLATRLYVNGGMTIAKCKLACQSASFSIVGLEYGGECWCGDEFENGGVLAAADGCFQPCDGQSSDNCGGPDRLNVFRLPSIKSTTTSAITSATTSTSSSTTPMTTLQTMTTSAACATSPTAFATPVPAGSICGEHGYFSGGSPPVLATPGVGQLSDCAAACGNLAGCKIFAFGPGYCGLLGSGRLVLSSSYPAVAYYQRECLADPCALGATSSSTTTTATTTTSMTISTILTTSTTATTTITTISTTTTIATTTITTTAIPTTATTMSTTTATTSSVTSTTSACATRPTAIASPPPADKLCGVSGTTTGILIQAGTANGLDMCIRACASSATCASIRYNSQVCLMYKVGVFTIVANNIPIYEQGCFANPCASNPATSSTTATTSTTMVTSTSSSPCTATPTALANPLPAGRICDTPGSSTATRLLQINLKPFSDCVASCATTAACTFFEYNAGGLTCILYGTTTGFVPSTSSRRFSERGCIADPCANGAASSSTTTSIATMSTSAPP